MKKRSNLKKIYKWKLRELKEQRKELNTYLVSGYVSINIDYSVNFEINLIVLEKLVKSGEFNTATDVASAKLFFEVEVEAKSPEEAKRKIEDNIYVFTIPGVDDFLEDYLKIKSIDYSIEFENIKLIK